MTASFLAITLRDLIREAAAGLGLRSVEMRVRRDHQAISIELHIARMFRGGA